MNGNENAIAVDAFELPEDKLVGTYESCAQAARVLYIRNATSILRQAMSKFNSAHLRGIPSYKFPDKKYRFQKSKTQPE